MKFFKVFTLILQSFSNMKPLNIFYLASYFGIPGGRKNAESQIVYGLKYWPFDKGSKLI